MNVNVRLICYFVMTWPLLGCSIKDPNLEELRRLCEQDAGVNIYRSVDADGYYNGSTVRMDLQKLTDNKFEFVEFCDEKPGYTAILKEPGCGRFTRAVKGSPSCDRTIQGILDESVGGTYAAFRENYCVEFELIEKPTARYFYATGRDVWMGEDGIAKFIRSSARITDRHTSQLMGEFITYILVPSPEAMILKSCDNIEGNFPSFEEADLVNTVLASPTN